MKVKPSPVAKNFFINTISFVLVALVGFLNLSLIVRSFGIETQGLVALANLLSAKGYFAIALLGLPMMVGRKVAHLKDNHDIQVVQSWIKGSYFLSIVLGLVVSLNFLVLQNFFPAILNTLGFGQLPIELKDKAVYFLILTIPLQFISVISQAVLFGQQQFAKIRSSEIISSLFSTVAILIAVGMSANGHVLLFTTFSIEALKSVYLIFWSNQGPLRISVSHFFNFKFPVGFYKEFKVCSASSGMAFLDNTAPAYFISHFLGLSGLGVFDTLTKASRILKTTFGLLNSSILPHAISKEAKLGGDSVVPMYFNSLTLVSLIIVPLVFCFGPISGGILGVWLGSGFEVYGKEFFLSLIGVVSIIFIGLQGAIFSSRLSVVRKTFWLNLWENILGLPTMIWMIIDFGIFGVFLNRFLVLFFGFIFRSLMICREYKISFRTILKQVQIQFIVAFVALAVMLGVQYSTESLILQLVGAIVMTGISWVVIYLFLPADKKEFVSGLKSQILNLKSSVVKKFKF